MGAFLIPVVVTTAMILATTLYVAAEFATVSARRHRISQQATAGNRLARLLEPVLADPHQLDTYIAACQLGITASSLILGFYGQSTIATALAPLLVQLGGLQELAAQSLAATVVLLGLTILQVVLGELVPKSVALRYPERLALITVIPMRWSVTLFRPLIFLFNGTSTLILRLLGVPPAGHHMHVHSPEEIELLVAESTRGGLLEPDERRLLRNAFRVGELTAADVMVPRTQIVGAPIDTPLRALLELVNTTAYTRIPLYRASIDDIAGIVHIKDLFRLHITGQDAVESILRAVPFVPETQPAAAIWNQLRQEQSYVAIVFDEHGGTAGMITVEDLIEEIVGELQDEYDEETRLIATGPDNRVRVRGDVLVDDINELFQLTLPTKLANTVGGLVSAGLGRPPRVGDEVTYGPISLRAEAISGTAVREVSIVPPTDVGLQLPGEFEEPA
jgi:CBS domain containing-hemolysin-like protein